MESKREVGKKLGADICIDPIHEDVKARLKEEGMTWVNTVIECVGRPSTIEQAIDIAGNKAVVMMFGLTKPDETISVKPFEIFRKELVLKASYINPYTQKRALDLIDSGRLDVSSMVYEVADLDEAGRYLKQSGTFAPKANISFHRKNKTKLFLIGACILGPTESTILGAVFPVRFLLLIT